MNTDFHGLFLSVFNQCQSVAIRSSVRAKWTACMIRFNFKTSLYTRNAILSQRIPGDLVFRTGVKLFTYILN